MGTKYKIIYMKRGDVSSYEYQTKYFISAICKFIKLRIKYDLVDLSYRK